jgi:hypothetical protein
MNTNPVTLPITSFDSPAYASTVTLNASPGSHWQQQPPPPAPIPIPSPVMNARGLADQATRSTQSNMQNGPGTNSDYNYDRDPEFASPPSGSERRGSFVGGFISSLKKLPNVVVRGHQSGEQSEVEHIQGTRRSRQTPWVPATASPLALPPTPTLLENEPSFDREPPHVLLSPAPGVQSPVLVEPRPSDDYAKMPSQEPPPPEPSLSDYVSRIYQFIKYINDLPWISPRTTVDYIPGQSSRSRTRTQSAQPAHRHGHGRSNTVSWYAPPMHQSIDLLSSGPSAMATLPDSNATLAYPSDTGAKNRWPYRAILPHPAVPNDDGTVSDPRHVNAPRSNRHVPSSSLSGRNFYPDRILPPSPARMI